MILLVLGIDPLSIDENTEGARCAGPDADGNTQLTFDLIFETHGLSFEISSEKTAFYLDGHLDSPPRQSPLVNSVAKV